MIEEQHKYIGKFQEADCSSDYNGHHYPGISWMVDKAIEEEFCKIMAKEPSKDDIKCPCCSMPKWLNVHLEWCPLS